MAAASSTSALAGLSGTQATITALAATALDDIFSGAKTLQHFQVDCTSNSGENVYFKAYDQASPTVGTTAPDIVLKGFKGVTKTYSIMPTGTAFDTNSAVSVACVQEAGQAGTTAPSGTIDVKVLTA